MLKASTTKETKIKKMGQVFTPEWIVTEILDSVGYKGEKILNKRIIDPACGDGAFLKEIVLRIINVIKEKQMPTKKLKEILENFVFGIEIDQTEYKKCIENLNSILKSEIGKKININWKIINDNSLKKYKDFLNFFDFVVGNPPYIRIHNLDHETRNLLKKNFMFSTGTIDIYVSFFELGFKLLNKKGTLGYITPNSFLRNTSYRLFRKFLQEHKAIKTLIDFKSNKIFKSYSTYTAITIINFSEKRNFFDYKELVNGKIKKVNEINYNELNEKNWSFTNKQNMEFLQQIYLKSNNKLICDFFDVQYGFATLRDKIFISHVNIVNKQDLVYFNNHLIEKKILKKIVKGSSYKGNLTDIEYIIFPYKKVGKRFIPIPEDELKKQYPYTYEYLLKFKEELLKRDIEKGRLWYEFGRSQGIQNCDKEKIVLSTLIKESINYYFLDDETYVYSGIFITKKHKETDWKIITSILSSEQFKKYIEITGKDFSGGYKSITTKQIKYFPTNHKDYSLLF